MRCRCGRQSVRQSSELTCLLIRMMSRACNSFRCNISCSCSGFTNVHVQCCRHGCRVFPTPVYRCSSCSHRMPFVPSAVSCHPFMIDDSSQFGASVGSCLISLSETGGCHPSSYTQINPDVHGFRNDELARANQIAKCGDVFPPAHLLQRRNFLFPCDMRQVQAVPDQAAFHLPAGAALTGKC